MSLFNTGVEPRSGPSLPRYDYLGGSVFNLLLVLATQKEIKIFRKLALLFKIKIKQINKKGFSCMHTQI